MTLDALLYIIYGISGHMNRTPDHISFFTRKNEKFLARFKSTEARGKEL
jgi:hypothetical protein